MRRGHDERHAQRRGRGGFTTLVAVALLCLAGCQPSLDSSPSTVGQNSLNGLDAFLAMSKEFGFKTSIQRRASDSLLDRGDVLFWCPQATSLPTESETSWINSWLERRPHRVVVFVGPWCDSTPLYWKKIVIGAPPAETSQLLNEKEDAEEVWEALKSSYPYSEECDWFRFLSPAGEGGDFSVGGVSTIGQPITGVPNWTRGLNARQAELDVPVVLETDYISDVLLAVGGRPLVTAIEHSAQGDGISHLLLVTNGTFIYNLPLVNVEHRKLAGRLLETVRGLARSRGNAWSWLAGQATATDDSHSAPLEALFLLGKGDVRPPSQGGSHWSVLGTPPLSYVLLQLTLLGLLFCFARWPIIGKPRELAASDTSDFGRHVEALAELLEQTRDEHFADRKVKQWHESEKRKSSSAAK